ncbi:hypothetical protein D9758_011685 [Tetrapyrgos nigripes]|uniref:Yeast cell wall synthesis Kre9/Knh1-like N-terminal domain-containing protein n=1 Tax=Tetrapyrgos nigripes TaxID=182062 RepID=A0A8H5GDG7_9AGAR|nr:hypothetical protein D9758_011685 [Tetrapyrgos nigripes]
MFFTKLAALATVLATATSSLAAAVPLEERRILDVFTPAITSPKAGDVWIVGEKRNVTWDTSSPPSQITNPNGRILLRKGETTTNVVLASNFSILLGTVEVEVPKVFLDADDYSVVLFGDSGNFSPKFTIEHNKTLSILPF